MAVKKEIEKQMTFSTEIRKMAAKLDRGVSFLIYADPGVGKTTMAATLPPDETIFINCEAGIGPLLGTNHNVFNLDSSNPLKIEKFYKFLRTEKHPFKYVVLDNISELEKLIQIYLTKKREKEFIELREYGDAANKIREIMRLFRDLVFEGMSVVVNAWEAPIPIKNSNGEILSRIFPKVSTKIAPEMCGIYDIVGHLEVSEKTGKRWLRLGPSELYITKTQFKGLDNGEVADLPMLLEKLYDYSYEQVG